MKKIFRLITLNFILLLMNFVFSTNFENNLENDNQISRIKFVLNKKNILERINRKDIESAILIAARNKDFESFELLSEYVSRRIHRKAYLILNDLVQ